MDGYPIFVRVTDKVRDELIIGNNADQIGAVPGDEGKEAFVRNEKNIEIRDRKEHEYIMALVCDHIDRAEEWGFDMAWFVRSARRILRGLNDAHQGAFTTEHAAYLRRYVDRTK